MPKASCYLTNTTVGRVARAAGRCLLAALPALGQAQDGYPYAYVQQDCAPQGGTAIAIVLTRAPWGEGPPPVPHYRATVNRAELRPGDMVWFDKTPFSQTPAGAAVRCEARGCEPVDARLRVTAVARGQGLEGLLMPSTGPRREQELSLPFAATWRPGRPACN